MKLSDVSSSRSGLSKPRVTCPRMFSVVDQAQLVHILSRLRQEEGPLEIEFAHGPM